MKAYETECPMTTPWGRAQQVERIADGIWQVSTAGHGGVYIAPYRREAMPKCLSDSTGYSSNGWFEEDCDWALACAAFPEEFRPRDCHYALQQMESDDDYLKERRAEYLKTPLAEVLRRQAAMHRDIVTV